ncbi:hypothetical protein DL96DRAFT_1290042 [Flagelloscypha sp. PMI_526]|nr:hypothetical protein DL96DRAFT_1290042 [Flagelloscypha sp. PMI_526]
MRQSQSRDLKSFFGTLVAHGNPRAQFQKGRGTLKSVSKLDTSLNAVGTTLQIAKDAGDAASKVSYVKAVAGVLSQIIRIRDEIQANKERCGEIIDLVQRKSKTILQSLDQVYEAKGATGLEKLKSELEDYADYLRTVLREELEPFKTQSRWTSYINRGKNYGDLHKLERELDDFNNRFSVKRLVEISVALLSKPIPPAKMIPQALPASPEIVIGRESVVESVVTVILSSSKPRVVILGQGGMGKTTIATIVLHDLRITSAYPTKYFVSSELAPTIELLETRIADTMSIPPSERGTDLMSQIADRISSDANPVLLCIDNLETIWEVESEQPRVDHFLEVLSGSSSKLAILITMRGTQEPKTSFSWEPFVLRGLDPSCSITMYETLSRMPADDSANELLSKLSGSPLAIKLFALMVKEGDKPSQLLSSWNEHGAKALEIGGRHRLSSLEQSIHLSVFSPRIDDTARLILSLIALMPDGLPTCSPWFQGFESVLPDNTVLQPTLRSLRRMALLDELGEPPRWQMLHPIRQFCVQFVDSALPVVIILVEFYVQTVSEHWNLSSFVSQTVILLEVANIRSLLLRGFDLQPLLSGIGWAGVQYGEWAYWRDIDESALLSSFLRLSVPSDEQAAIYCCMGKLHHHWNRLDAAGTSLAHALELYSDVQDRGGQANTHRNIGDLRMRQDELEAAGTSFAHALELYGYLHNHLGEAHTRESIGELHMRQDQLDLAEASFICALELYRDVHDQLGEANVYYDVGYLHQRRGQLGEAKASAILSLERYREIQDQWGIARSNSLLGEVCLRKQELGAADSAFSQALSIYKDIGSNWGIADIRRGIGDLCLQRMQLDDAETALNSALDIYTNKVQSRVDEARTNRSIGELHVLRGQFEESEQVFHRALELDTLAGSRFGRGKTHRCMGKMFTKKGDLKAAESSYTDSLRLFVEINDYQVNPCLLDLGKVWVQQGKIEESEALDAELLRLRWDVGEKT